MLHAARGRTQHRYGDMKKYKPSRRAGAMNRSVFAGNRTVGAPRLVHEIRHPREIRDEADSCVAGGASEEFGPHNSAYRTFDVFGRKIRYFSKTMRSLIVAARFT
jgi:hypothetical protein